METTQPFGSQKGPMVLDHADSPLNNYQCITTFVKEMPLEDRIEMLLTLRSWVSEELK